MEFSSPKGERSGPEMQRIQSAGVARRVRFWGTSLQDFVSRYFESFVALPDLRAVEHPLSTSVALHWARPEGECREEVGRSGRHREGP